jgi:hypothetical protein
MPKFYAPKGRVQGFTFDEIWQAGYDQCRIDDLQNVATAMSVIQYLNRRVRELEAELEVAKNG